METVSNISIPVDARKKLGALNRQCPAGKKLLGNSETVARYAPGGMLCVRLS